MKKLSRELGPRYREEGPPAGFTRVVKLGPRPNDRAMMAQIELVNNPYRIWEERQQAQRADELGKPTFWEWELKILRQEQVYFKAQLDKVQMKIDKEIAAKVSDIVSGEGGADDSAVRAKVEEKYSAKMKFLLHSLKRAINEEEIHIKQQS